MNVKTLLIFSFLGVSAGTFAQINLNTATKDLNSVMGKNNNAPLSNDDIIKGLKDALSVGSKNAGGSASKVDGFYKNPQIKIPFPPDAEKVRKTAVDVGMQKQ